MARIDKYDPVAGGFRAPLNAALTGAAAPLGVGLNSSGRVVAGAGVTGIIAVIVSPYDKGAGDIIDNMTNGELVEFGGVAGTVYTANTTTGVISSAAASATQVRVGHTVEADRLVVRCGTGAGVLATAVVGDQAAIADLALADIDAASGEPTAAALDDANTNGNAIEAKINDILAKLRLAGVIAP